VRDFVSITNVVEQKRPTRVQTFPPELLLQNENKNRTKCSENPCWVFTARKRRTKIKGGSLLAYLRQSTEIYHTTKQKGKKKRLSDMKFRKREGRKGPEGRRKV
jgi:hypothetical protein